MRIQLPSLMLPLLLAQVPLAAARKPCQPYNTPDPTVVATPTFTPEPTPDPISTPTPPAPLETVASPSGRFKLRMASEPYSGRGPLLGSATGAWIMWMFESYDDYWWKLTSDGRLTGVLLDSEFVSTLYQKYEDEGGPIGQPYNMPDPTYGLITCGAVSADGGITSQLSCTGVDPTFTRLQICDAIPGTSFSVNTWIYLGNSLKTGCYDAVLAIKPEIADGN
ncbi:hypothetical protein B0J13DRAFT_563004 [Dactylonectria estremocensis]|uniref:Uncharacterized protein n=1 Tax=Dactylonectria estremocensis TaxID=1079267 RepID=A0A9P9IUL7_9HYPO|nr:hypothetical protein B0J13DRAFT_563004 [Dactylonectria estremocensis]